LPNTPERAPTLAVAVAFLLVCCTVLGLAGTDLVLPAVPGLPAALGGSIEQAQLVLATFAAGTGVGLLLFGELGARLDHRSMLAVAMLFYGLLSAAAAQSSSLPLLVALRFLQGVAAACAAVVTPGIVRALFSEKGSLRALGMLGSVESLAPAIAPIIGVWLLDLYGWQASFWVTAVLSLLLAALVLKFRALIPQVQGKPSRLGYWLLLRNKVFQRYALSQGLSLGALLAFVFAMPTVYVITLDGSIRDFIVMQLLGISTFIIGANASSHLVERFGVESTVFWGSAVAVLGSVGMLLYALFGGREPWMIWLLFLPFNMGFGFRGPPGFFRALQASDGDDARASALVILYVMFITAAATALIAPLISQGLWPPALAAVLLGVASLGVLRWLPGLPD
jgi:DHA1 family bicyclomycin/chloramphenicol resistance-like MFS transporter